jgi:WD40 repeat protein
MKTLPILTAALFLPAAAALAEPLTVAALNRTDEVNFGKEIYPFLRANCLACHNNTKSKADLILESPKDMIKGGETGPAIVPGKGADSLLFTTAAHIEEPTMPPANNKSKAKDLTPEQLALLKLWIDQGAKGDAVSSEAPTSWTVLKGPQPIFASAVSKDGRYAAAGRGQQIHIYDVRLGALVATLRDPSLKEPVSHLDLVHHLAFSPDGRLASGGYREAKIWEREASSATKAVSLPADTASVATTADGKKMALGAADGSISLINLDQPEAAPVNIKDHAGAVTGLAFSADGATLYSVSADKTLKRRPVADAAKVVSLDLPAPGTAVAVIEGGKRLVIGAGDNVIRLCVAEFKPVAAAPAAPAPAAGQPAAPAPAAPAGPFVELKAANIAKPAVVLAVANADGNEFLAALEDGAVIHLKTDPAKPEAAPTEVRRLAHGQPLSRMAVSIATARVATAGPAGPVSLWNLADGKKIIDLKGDPKIQPQIEELAAKTAVTTRLKAYWDKQATDAAALAKAESDKAKAADAEIAKAKTELDAKNAALAKVKAQNPAAKPEELTKATDEAAAAERNHTGSIRNKELSTKLAGEATAKETAAKASAKEQETALAAIKTQSDALTKQNTESDAKVLTGAIAFSADGTALAQSLADGTVRLRSGETGAWMEDIAGTGAVRALAFAGSTRVLAARDGKTAQVLSLPGTNWKLAKTLGDGKKPDPFVDRVTALAFSPDGSKLATGSGVPSRNGEIKLWDTKTWTPTIANADAHGDTITSFVFSPKGDRLASGSTDRMVKIHGVADLKHQKTLEGHTNHVLDVDWNADGLSIVSAGADLQIKIWDIAEGQQKQKVEGYTKEVSAVAYVGATDTVVTASGDQSLKLANAALPDSGTTFLHTAAASADGKVIISGGQDSVLRVHDAVGKKLVKAFPSPDAPPPAPATAAK